MARNRKRAKERRARRPQPVGRRAREETLGPPSPLEHAAPDAELAEQAELPPDHELELSEADEQEFEEEAEAKAEAYEEEELEADGRGGGGGRFGSRSGGSQGGAGGGQGGGGGQAGSGGELAVPSGAGAVSVPRPHTGSRLMNFFRGSWAELQRVQWPDRRQVMQATGVVIGFVIVAGLFLGAADWVGGKIINYILNGHF